jgi:hypothetical protein
MWMQGSFKRPLSIFNCAHLKWGDDGRRGAVRDAIEDAQEALKKTTK